MQHVANGYLCSACIPFPFFHANGHLPLLQATGHYFARGQTTGEVGRVPAPPHPSTWQLELDDAGVAFLAPGEDGEEQLVWRSDFLRYAIYTGRASGKLWVYDDEAKAASELDSWLHFYRGASWHVRIPSCHSEAQFM